MKKTVFYTWISCAAILLLMLNQPIRAANELITAGSYIINMGVVPQTFENGLLPYGMIQEIMNLERAPVKWSISPSKGKDGTDFVYDTVAYRGGTFIIPTEVITPEIVSIISSWEALGVIGVYTTIDISVPIYGTLTYFPLSIFDPDNPNDIEDYYKNAGIPDSLFSVGLPSALTACDDTYILAHSDPEWATHRDLYDFVTVDSGNVFLGCHTVSMMEGIVNPGPPYQRLNFLSDSGLQCYSDGKCGPYSGDHDGSSNGPYSYNADYAGHPIMQFMGDMSGATDNGSERWYIPWTNSSWFPTTARAVITADGAYPREGVLIAFGHAYGDSTNGLIMYEGGHSLDNGSEEEKVAAQRAFFNFQLISAIQKVHDVSMDLPTALISGVDSVMFALPLGNFGPYSYEWSSSCPGSFSDSLSASTTFNPDPVASPTSCLLKVIVTDLCGRRNIQYQSISLYPPVLLPVSLSSFEAELQGDKVILSWQTESEQQADFFEIERRYYNSSLYKASGRVDATGMSQTMQSYGFTDDVSALPAGNIYYRLKQFDTNGSFVYSKEIEINYSYENLLETKIYPNPTSGDQLILEYHSPATPFVNIRMYNTYGDEVYSAKAPAGSFSAKWELPVKDFPPGMYFVKVSGGKTAQSLKVIIN